MWHDVRYAVRLALRNPVPSLIAALTLALGIGASTTLFSVAWGVLMKPLPWAEPDTLIRLKESREGATRAYPWTFTNHAYLAWTDAPGTIEALAAYAPSTLTLTGFGEPQRVKVTAATASLFSVLRAVPLHGALFSAEDEAAPAVTVVSHGFWQRQLGGRPDAVGDTLTLDGRPHTIVGILPRGFSFPDAETIALVPYRVGPSRSPDGVSRIQMFSGIARLKRGVTPAQAAEEATARARHAVA